MSPSARRRTAAATSHPVSPVFGAHYRVEPKKDAQGRLVFLPQAAYGPPEKAYGHVADGTPGYYVDGAGRVALVPWTIGRSYHELGLSTLATSSSRS